jgi:hypothetical protein
MLVRFQPGLPFELECRISAFFLAIALSVIAQGKKKIPIYVILASNGYGASNEELTHLDDSKFEWLS